MSNVVDGLRSSDFHSYFSKGPTLLEHWQGVKSIDQIPRNLKLRKFVIVNLSPSGHPGSHWIVLCRSEKNQLELFNSLGTRNLSSIRNYLNFNFKCSISYNNSPVQLPTTTSCGLYCIYFAVHRIFNFDMKFSEVMEEIFEPELKYNEDKVENFCRHLSQISHPLQLFDLDL